MADGLDALGQLTVGDRVEDTRHVAFGSHQQLDQHGGLADVGGLARGE
jgi:hypothetical protein